MIIQDSLAEWSKALASGASPQGRGLEPHSCHSLGMAMRRRCAWSTVAALDMEDTEKPEIVNKYLARSFFHMDRLASSCILAGPQASHTQA